MLRKWLILLTLGVAACGGTSGAEGSSASVTAPPRESTTTTTGAMTPEEEVEAAYLESWDVYSKSLRRLDDSLYPEVFAGEALDLRRREMTELRAAGTPVRVSIEHNYSISVVDDHRAVVLEAYENHSVLLDGKTGEPTEPDPNTTVRRQYAMELLSGSWKIVRVLDGP